MGGQGGIKDIPMEKIECQNKPFGHPVLMRLRVTPPAGPLPWRRVAILNAAIVTVNTTVPTKNRPGRHTKVIKPEEAVERVRLARQLEPRINVVGIAGPGDPLANQATFQTFELVKASFPDMSLCLSTNGLLLPDYIDRLVELGVGSLTVTVNALDPAVGAQIYAFVSYRNTILRGEEAALCLRDNQLAGLKRAAAAGLRLKINSVLIPGINEDEMTKIARVMQGFKAAVMNIMPLIPQAARAFTAACARCCQAACAPYVEQMTHCKQCRADACGLLEEPLQC
jgi:nitrogen fixation protein NifB